MTNLGSESGAQPGQRLYFFHIPNTAGTSVRYWLADLFAAQDWFQGGFVEQLAAVTSAAIQRFRFFSGQFAFELPARLDEPIPTVTWLRDPVAREISSFQCVQTRFDEMVQLALRQNQPQWVKYYERAKNSSLKQICESDAFVGFRDNLQTRYLSGTFPHARSIAVDRAMLARAKSNLAQMIHVGICEWMAPSIDLLAYRLGCPYRPLGLRANRTEPSAVSLADDDTLSVIREVNRFDQELYQYGQELFSSQFAEFWKRVAPLVPQGPTPPAAFSNYESPELVAAVKQTIDEHFFWLHRDDTCRSEVDVHFSQAVYLNGWYPREAGRARNSIRWAGPSQTSSIFLPIEPSCSYKLTCDADDVAHQGVLQNLKIRVGPESFPVQWRQMVRRSGERFLRMTSFVPREVLCPQRRFQEIAFETTGDFSVQVSREGTRHVSLATDGIQMRAA